LVQDLDAARSNSTRVTLKQPNPSRVSILTASKVRLQSPRQIPKTSVENKCKGIDKEFSKLTPTIKCYKCQGYGHVTANCASPVKIALVNEVPKVVSESDSDEFIFRGEDFDMDDETTVMTLVLTVLDQQPWLTYPSLGTLCLSQRRKTTGDERQYSTSLRR